MKVIILRPEPGASLSSEVARSLGFDPIIASASEIKPIAWDIPSTDRFDALMITSANALRVNAQHISRYKDLPLFAVGKATAALAKDMGFTVAAIGQGGAKALFPKLIDYGAKNVLRLVGADYVPVDATDAIQITTIITYEAQHLPISSHLKALFIDQSNGPHIFTFHSERAAQIFHRYVDHYNKIGHIFDTNLHYAAVLAPSIAKSVGTKWKKLLISPNANDHAMMTMISESL